MRRVRNSKLAYSGWISVECSPHAYVVYYTDYIYNRGAGIQKVKLLLDLQLTLSHCSDKWVPLELNENKNNQL